MRPTVLDAAEALRDAIVRDGCTPAAFRAVLAGVPPEDLDAWLDVLWGIDGLPDDDPGLPRGCVPYLPCPVETVLEALEVAAVTADDVLVDVGAGLGRVVGLTHLCTGAEGIGLEIQPALVEGARTRSARLGASRVRFVEGDATELVREMTTATVFFLYCPFSGARLEQILDDLEGLARARPLRICCVGMAPLRRSWLRALPATSVDLAVYRSCPHGP